MNRPLPDLLKGNGLRSHAAMPTTKVAGCHCLPSSHPLGDANQMDNPSSSPVALVGASHRTFGTQLGASSSNVKSPMRRCVRGEKRGRVGERALMLTADTPLMLPIVQD